MRGVAILAVLVYHFFSGWSHWGGPLQTSVGHILRTGYLGVDLFFVLSGFLITGVLLDGSQEAHRWKNFFARRTLRIFPAYYAVLFLSFTLVPWLDARIGTANSPLTSEMVSGWPWFASYLSNYYLPYHEGYPIGLSLTWTLAVEEQFYLAWPWLIWFVPREKLLRCFVGVMAASVAFKFALYFTHLPPGALRYFMPSCMDRFAAGGAVAVAIRQYQLPATVRSAFVWTGLLGILPVLLVSTVFWAKPNILLGILFRDLASAWVSMALILLVTTDSAHSLKRVFEWQPLRAIGVYSYGLYLVHAPVIGWWLQKQPHGPLNAARVFDYVWRLTGACVTSLGLAYLLHLSIERPMQRIASRFRS